MSRTSSETASEKARTPSPPTQPTRDVEQAPAAGSHLGKDTSSPTRSITGWRWLLVCLPLYVSIFVYGLDTTIAADIQGPVVAAFEHPEQLAWLGTAFSLGSVSCLPLVRYLYANFNIKYIYLGSLVLFEAGSALCGAAPNMSALIVGRVIAGMGGAGIYLGNLNFFTALTTAEERGTYLTGNGFFWGIGAVLGPLVGGGFVASDAGWRFSFYINLFIAAVFVPAYLWGLPSHKPSTTLSFAQRIKNIDYLGTFLFFGLWASFAIAFTMPGAQWKWNDGRTIGTIVAFALAWILFGFQQVFCIGTSEKNRLFPVYLIKSRTHILLFTIMAANVTALFVPIYFIPIYFQFVHNDSAIQAAIRLLPFVIISATVNVSAGYLLARLKYHTPLFMTSGLLVTLGWALLTAYLDPSTPASQIYGFTVLAAFGNGLSQQLGYVVATIKAPKNMGDALSLQMIAQIGGVVIGLVIAGQVFQTTALRNLTEVLAGTNFTAREIQDAVTGVQSRVFQQLNGELRDKAILAITEAVQNAFILACVGGGVILVASLLMKHEKLYA